MKLQRFWKTCGLLGGLTLWSPFLWGDRGGPDGFGYYWVDSSEEGGPVFNWIDVTTSGVRLPLGNDQNTGPLSLAAPFWFYGQTFSDLRVCSNGWVSFTATGNAFPVSLPDPSFPYLIAPFATDLVPTPSGQAAVYFGIVQGKAVIQWVGVPHLVNPNATFDFEVILDPSDSSITFQYLHAEGIGWNSIDRVVGIQDGSGTYYLAYSSPDHFRPLQDSFAIRFYFYPYPDLQGIEILMPHDGMLLFPGISMTPQALFRNAGPMSTTVTFVCEIDSTGIPVYSDTSEAFTLLAGDSAAVGFRSWVPSERVDYRMQVYPVSAGDPIPGNDTLRRRVRIPYPADSLLSYAYGRVASAFGAQDEAFFALAFEAPETMIISHIRIYLIGEGDSLWPFPDSGRDPVVVGLWGTQNGGLPGPLIYADTLLRDTAPPGWVYSVPPGTVVIPGGRFFVGVSTWVRGHGMEGLGLDGVLDYPEAQWRYSPGGGWSQGVWAPEGDPWIEVYYSRGPTEVVESWVGEGVEPIQLSLQGAWIRLSPAPRSPYRLYLFNSTGRKVAVFRGKGGQSRWPFPAFLPQGVYLLRFEGRGLILNYKVLWVGQD